MYKHNLCLCLFRNVQTQLICVRESMHKCVTLSKCTNTTRLWTHIGARVCLFKNTQTIHFMLCMCPCTSLRVFISKYTNTAFLFVCMFISKYTNTTCSVCMILHVFFLGLTICYWITSWCPLLCYFSCTARDLIPGCGSMALPTMGQAFSHQLTAKKCPQQTCPWASWWRQFFSWGSLFPGITSLCQVDKRNQNTHLAYKNCN